MVKAKKHKRPSMKSLLRKNRRVNRTQLKRVREALRSLRSVRKTDAVSIRHPLGRAPAYLLLRVSDGDA